MQEKVKEVIILSAGEGKRLWPSTKEIPKALIKINNKTLIDYQIDWLKKYDVDKIILTLKKEYFDIAKKELGDRVIYSLENETFGTAGGIKNVLSQDLIEGEEFFVLNVDDLTDINLDELAEKGSNTICLARMRCPYGIVYTKGDFVEKFEEKPLLDLLVNCGVYLFNKSINKKLPSFGDLERDVFPFLKLKYHKHSGNWETVNTQKDIEELNKGRLENKQKKILITGGAGFIGSNIAEHFLLKENKVIIFDNLSRPERGAEKNIEYLLEKYKNNPNLKFINGDIKSFEQLSEVIKDIDIIFHIAAQTAMTTSIENPLEDFEVNAKGTFNVLEAARKYGGNPIIIYTSTNKVYGDLTKNKIKLVEKEKRWDFADNGYENGIDESYPLDFEGPYGCSKGSGDSYCLDYARTFGMKTVVFRMSGIYGISQHPTEDQGWIGWFIRRAIEKKPATIYGDGKQIRDVLFISDLLNAFEKTIENINKIKGEVYNIGGGRENSISILELLEFLEKELKIKSPAIKFDEWRRADQKVYISNTQKAKKDFGWEPKVKKEEGIRKLYEWMKGLV